MTMPIRFHTDIHVHNDTKRMVLDLDEQIEAERSILAHLRAGQYYEPDISLAMLRIVRTGDVVVDVGANLGFFTVLLATLVGPAGRVLSAEPGENNLPRLQNNIAANEYGNVIVIDRPIADRAVPVTFFLNSDNDVGNALWNPGAFPGNDRSKAQTISHSLMATTLDEEISRLGCGAPRLIKIDTEGAEQRVLEGAHHLLLGRKVPFVICELHNFGLAQMGCSPMSLRQMMEDYGYSTFLIYPDGTLPKLIPPQTEIQCRYIRNILFSTPELVSTCWPVEIY